MKNLTKYDVNDNHPLLQSGEWEGFYTYALGASAIQHPMTFFLEFWNGIMSGHGKDEIDVFSWRGKYNKQIMTCEMIKFYATYSVDYKGYIDENGIWGTWTIKNLDTKGGFHIWHKNHKPNKTHKK